VGHEILQTTLANKQRLANKAPGHLKRQKQPYAVSKAANQFSDCRRTNSCPILNERVCEVFPHLWWSWPRTCMFFEYVPYMLCWINIRGWSGQSIHPIHFALSVLIDTTSPARKGVSVHNHKVLVHSTSIRVTNVSLISSQ